jgi:hypothetical protein
MNQEMKANLAPAIKAILAEYGVKGTISVRHHMALVVKITAGKLDFINNYKDRVNSRWGSEGDAAPPVRTSLTVNTHWFTEDFTDECLEFLTKLINAMNVGNHDRSDIMTDLFDVGWYIDIHIGTWEKPYLYIP